MSAARMTPGPWRAVSDGTGDHQAVYSDNDIVAEYVRNPADRDAIAALPELVAALQTILFAVTADADNNDGRVDRLAVFHTVREALAKVPL